MLLVEVSRLFIGGQKDIQFYLKKYSGLTAFNLTSILWGKKITRQYLTQSTENCQLTARLICDNIKINNNKYKYKTKNEKETYSHDINTMGKRLCVVTTSIFRLQISFMQ